MIIPAETGNMPTRKDSRQITKFGDIPYCGITYCGMTYCGMTKVVLRYDILIVE